MSVLILPKCLSVADGVLLQKVMVHTQQFQVGLIPRLSLQRVDGQGPVLVAHKVLRTIIYTGPQHLQLTVHHGRIACPVKPLLVNLACPDLRLGLLSFGMAQVGTAGSL